MYIQINLKNNYAAALFFFLSKPEPDFQNGSS